MGKHRIAVIPGDGIGKEVVPEGLRVLDAAARKFGIELAYDHFDFACCDYYVKHGRMMPEDWKARIGAQVSMNRLRGSTVSAKSRSQPCAVSSAYWRVSASVTNWKRSSFGIAGRSFGISATIPSRVVARAIPAASRRCERSGGAEPGPTSQR